ncbi:hypothetical protein K402DRAFT_336565 [Aulographum hederae CBS 113979]|uniref:Tc1-like transposase DDE domain-containing protein n=1 Tax=Aulographum hederae CBS 113979 TaxID=1176131 RepID=A0A6G1GUP8_9PEZI|nr:hypothetical protein K402DRAFT_336565 [Aulographum hederae CBS 113979]
MTQYYYTKRVLPTLIKETQRDRIEFGKAWLQEDNDPSHGTRSEFNLPRLLEEKEWIPFYLHPAQSPELNPMEGIWNILKQRVKLRRWRTISELKAILLEEWKQISIEEIRKRIDEMPRRCRIIVEIGGKPYKSATW